MAYPETAPVEVAVSPMTVLLPLPPLLRPLPRRRRRRLLLLLLLLLEDLAHQWGVTGVAVEVKAKDTRETPPTLPLQLLCRPF